MAKNPFGKTMPKEKPYAIYKSYFMPGWAWYVCKTYQSPDNEKKNPYARWFCWVTSPMIYGEFEAGDTYIREIIFDAHAYLFEATDEWKKYYYPPKD